LCGQLLGRLGHPLAHGLASGQQFAAGTLGEPLGPGSAEQVIGPVERSACFQAPVLATQPFVVQEVLPFCLCQHGHLLLAVAPHPPGERRRSTGPGHFWPQSDLASLVYGFIEGGHRGSTHPAVIVALGTAVATLAGVRARPAAVNTSEVASDTCDEPE
jgi:hypothetical protein